MISREEVQRQLRRIKQKNNLFYRSEIDELANILNAGETIHYCIFGFYQGGSAILVATGHRLLLIDKKPFFLNLEDIRYEMINEVDFAGRLLDAAVRLHTGYKELKFVSLADAKLRRLCNFIQDQITRARQLEHMLEQAKPAAAEWRPYTLLPRQRVSKFPS